MNTTCVRPPSMPVGDVRLAADAFRLAAEVGRFSAPGIANQASDRLDSMARQYEALLADAGGVDREADRVLLGAIAEVG